MLMTGEQHSVQKRSAQASRARGDDMHKHIMIPLDGSELSAKAVDEGIGLAKALASKLTLLTVVQPHHTRVSSPFASSIVQEFDGKRDEEHAAAARNFHDGILSRARSSAVACDSMVVMGESPYEKIIESAEARQCDLIVMASHGRRGLDALLLGSETVKVLTHSRIPVLVVR
jgi:nucleotide-binding universal stress UspA family protein